MDLARLFSQLLRVENLDIWEGLIHVGCDRIVYADALRLFCRDLERKSLALAGFLDQEDWKNYTAEIHALKGGLAGIGAWELAKKTRALEEAVRKEDYGFCREASGTTLEEMRGLVAALRSTILFTERAIEEEQSSLKLVSMNFLEKKLNELYWFCFSGRSIEANTLAKELKTTTHTKETDALVHEICTHVENLDYHLVLKLLVEKPFIHKGA